LRLTRPVGSVSYPELCRLAGFEVPRVGLLLKLIAGRAAAHVDLKDPACAEEAVRTALAVLGPDRVIVTTGDRVLARAVRQRFPAVQAGLTIGGDSAQAASFAMRAARARLTRAAPGSRLDDVAAAGANWAVVHHRAAGGGLLASARSRGLRTMIWTVNGDDALARWLACSHADVIVTDQPVRAIAIRDRSSPPLPRR
jgi:glycerophosphoryl diester phosphodiesterase